MGTFGGVKIMKMLSKVVQLLDEASDSIEAVTYPSETGDQSDGDDELQLEDDESENESLGGWSPQSPHGDLVLTRRITHPPTDDAGGTLNQRIRQDLRNAKDAGFRVGHLGCSVNSGQDVIVTVSCRVAKLGISEEALQAWHLDPSKYFLLLIRYTAGYHTLEKIVAEDACGHKIVETRVGLSESYKINISDAINAFGHIKGRMKENFVDIPGNLPSTGEFSPLFIGGPLDQLMNVRLARLLKFRLDNTFQWGCAELFYNDHQGCDLPDDHDPKQVKYWNNELKSVNALPDLVTADHLKQASAPYSFPLVAMQFALRHLVRCTEFCLVCHCKLEHDFEALKPYVCSNPLCLYQYMNLGFGPSIEHEILSQPYVVDLLISFCYSSAGAGKLSSLPLGMPLLVPPPLLISTLTPSTGHFSVPKSDYLSSGGNTGSVQSAAVNNSSGGEKLPIYKIHKARLDRSHMELLLPPGDQTLRLGNWIYLKISNTSEHWHCRVLETLYPTIRLGPPVFPKHSHIRADAFMLTELVNAYEIQYPSHRLSPGSTLTPADIPSPQPKEVSSSLLEVQFILYEQSFDDLNDNEKQKTIQVLLDTLPSVRDMKTFLESRNGKDTSLSAWSDRISPAVLSVLRWIIASNRSCIVQVDSLEGDTKTGEARVTGMPGWMQFRFAQGAPDKEQRFITSVREMTEQSAYPTLFAWHGSPLPNWHGIVREGLHFRETIHGRVYGNGVYHALDVATSIGYCHMYHGPINGLWGQDFGPWPQSELKISSAVALNEIVNAPKQFVSTVPHLVVSQLEWIQTRYLFVKGSSNTGAFEDNCAAAATTEFHDQDPAWTPVGSNRRQIIIPITAVSKSRRQPAPKAMKKGHKKIKVTTTAAEPGPHGTILLSDATDSEDVDLLMSEVEHAFQEPNGSEEEGKNFLGSSHKPSEISQTGFVPDALSQASLPLIPPPSYATSMATRALQREMSNTLQTQNTHPPEELGWYIDPDLVNNVYQWIVALHSFEAQLPLAQDMKAKGLKSVILEIRFGKEYPISPPFVRIIRPRFLCFNSGGGGHVTAGGAMCMELLTNSGWSAVSNIESVLLQVRLALSSTDPRPARLEHGPVRDYGVAEAMEAFVRACHAHGVSFGPFFFFFLGEGAKLMISTTQQWEVPNDFKAMH